MRGVRRPRNETEPGIAHVWARGVRRLPIFEDDEDREHYLTRLAFVTRSMGWRCLAYCLMTNHVHLLIETTRPNLGEGMRDLHGGHAQAYNRRYGHTGHLFEDRYSWNPIGSEDHLRTEAAYIVLNPVKAGLAAGPGEWRWDSWSATVGDEESRFVDAARLLEFFSDGADRTTAYVRFVKATLASRPGDD